MSPEREQKRVVSLGLTLALHGMNHAMFNMLTPLGLTISAYFGFGNLAKVTTGFSLYLALYGFGQIPIGFLSDRVSRKLLLGSGAILNGLAIALTALHPTYGTFLASMTLAGTGAAAYHPVGASYLSDLFKNARGSALGISGIGATLGLFAGPVLSGFLNEIIGWRWTFMCFAAACTLLGLVFIAFASEPARDESAGAGNGSGWSRGIIVFLAMAATVFTLREFAGWGGYYILPIFSETIYHTTTRYSGFVGGLQSVGGFIAQPLGGWLSDRFGRRWLMSGLLLLAAVFMVAIPFSGQAGLIPSVFLYGLGYTATVPIIDAMIADRTPGRIRGSVFGIFMAAGIGLSAASPIIQAKILDATGVDFAGFVTCFILLGATLLASMVVLLLFRNAEK